MANSLILKPTELCNFKCTFCSSTKLSDEGTAIVELSEIETYLIRFPETQTIIVNGGDPLMMPPKYYWDIIEILDRLKCPASISFTTNLWAFYKKPEMWTELFKHPRVGVCTSFQFGNARLKGDLKPFTVEEFWAISTLFLAHVGYRPDFISVITPENVDTVMDTVLLAKEMGVQAKINHAVASGPEVEYKGIIMGNHNSMFTQADIYEHYVMIHNAGLAKYEYNTQQMARRLIGDDTTCPLSRSCDEGIRSLQPGKGYYSCGAFGDDQLFPIDFDREMAGEFFTPLQVVPELASMKESCFVCPMFAICNGCKKTIHDTKRLGLTEHHCRKMKSLAPQIIEINGLTGHVEPTDYVDESVQLIAKG
jgi:sulfatase maturation enzyme AslB (radical SAM superfamily)